LKGCELKVGGRRWHVRAAWAGVSLAQRNDPLSFPPLRKGQLGCRCSTIRGEEKRREEKRKERKGIVVIKKGFAPSSSP